jgi:hypothetical protein
MPSVTVVPRRAHRRIEVRAPQRCARCRAPFIPARADARYCSDGCRQAAYRDRRPRPWVLVVWERGGDMTARFTYYATEAAAAAHAPTDGRPSTVVYGRRPPWRHLPSVEDLVRRSRSMLEQRKWPLGI